MATNSISSSSFRLVTTRIPLSLFRKTPTLLPTPSNPNFPFKTITFQRLHPSPPPPSSSSSSSSPSPSTSSLQPISELPPKLQEIVHLFQSVSEPKAKYEQLLFYGKNLKPLEPKFKTNENKVQGCVSQVWVRAYLDPNLNVVFEADSDSVLTKGLAALLVQGLSGRPVNEIVRVTPDFVSLLGLQQSLTPSRNNGFLNMLKLMQAKALMLYIEAEKGNSNSNSNSNNNNRLHESESESGSVVESGGESNENEGSERVLVSALSGEGDVELGGRGMRIREKLERELEPLELEIEDVSYQHAGHGGVRGSDGETHFNVRVVSRVFEGKSLVKRHRLIYGLLQEELEAGLHALSIVAKTPEEVEG